MLLKSIRRMEGLCFEGRWRWTHHFLLVIWLSLMTATPPKALGYFLGDTKAVLNGCEDHWTLQDRATMPLLLQMTLCVDIRVVVPGAWVAFSYSSVLTPGPELGLEGDDEALYGWLLRVRHKFPMQLSPTHWHRVCLRRDVSRNSFSLEVDGKMVAERTVIARAIPPNGSLFLGCQPRDRPPGAVLGQVELYLFRMWADQGNHGLCEDGTVIGWNAQSWGLTSPRAAQRDPNLLCVDRRQLSRGARAYRSITTALPTGYGRSLSLPLETPSTTTTTTTLSSVIPTSVKHMSNQMSQATVSTPRGSTTVNSNQTEPPSVTPASANHSTDTDKKPSNFQNSSVTPSTNGIPLSIPTPVNQTTASNAALPFAAVPVSGASSAYQRSASTQTSLITSLLVNQTTPGRTLTLGSPLVNCDISQLCSNTSVYFWMSISVEAQGDNKTEQDVVNLVSNTFSCQSNAAQGVTGFIDFCQGDRQLQAVQVNCSAKSNIRQTTCNVLLKLSHAVSVCELQRAGVSALQQAGHQQIQATIIGEVERVGRDVCGDVEPSSGGFVRCTSTSSLEEICQANNHSKLTCSLIDPNSNAAPQPNKSCSSQAPRFCDCTAFCNSASQFFAMRINIISASFNVNALKVLLSGLSAARACNTMSGSVCQDISKLYQHAHLECHGTPQRLYSCMVILEMSGPVNGCALNILLQQVIDNNSGITSETPLTRMVVCGPPGLTVSTLLISNLTWVASDLLTADVCQPDPTLLKCEANESLAVLLTDSCPPEPSTTKQSMTQPSNLTNSTTTPKALTPSVTNTTAAENTPTVQKTNTSQGTAQPNMTTPLTTINVAPLNNQTGNHTTGGVTHTVSTTSKDNNFTTAATVVSTVVSTVVNVNQTTGISFNLSSTASSLTTDFNLTTKGPEVNLTTTAANASLEATNSTTTTTTVHGTLPAQINTTTATVTSTSSTTTLQTTTITNTTTTKPGTGSTSTTIAETTTSQTAREEQANELLNQTQDVSQLNSSQVAQLVRKLEKLIDGPTVSQAVGQKVVNIISNLMEADSLALSASANSLVQLVDDLGLKLVVTGDREILSSGSLVLAVRTVDGTNFPTTSVDIFNTDNVQLRALSRSRSKRSGSALGSVFLPSSLTTGLSPEQQKQANRVQFTFYTKAALFKDAALDNKTLVSPVLAASVTNLSISNLSENIQFTIQNINPIYANYAASCAFWDFTLNGGGGGWGSAGCFVVNSTQEETTCSCNHLTSFAILLDLSREGIIDRKQAQILTFITYIGCGISAIFLALTLLTYLLFEKLLRDIPAKILVQLCLSLLLLNLVFLLDGWLALYPAVGLCISTAFFLHYFLLTSFTWAGLEALHMYLSIVRVFTPYLSRYMLKFSLIGWGLPLLVVIIVISVDKNNYGLVTYGKYTDGTSDDFCWLRNDIAFYVGVVAYFLLIFALCLLVFIVVMVQLSRIKKQNPQNQPPNRGVMTDLRSITGLIILLGLTWGFSLFAWGPLYLPFVYLFTIFNSLQGFLVFVFHCAVKENVRRQWRTYLCCGSLRLPENSDWSRTATQNNRNMSATTATTSAPHFTSRSSSVISNVTNSSGSVFWDSGIYDGSNSDAHLNEIHRQNLSP
ncbi:hypothetical protein PFLUV_G00258280 [Perca fluviatilis]|uniref:Adhesion G-protein coupled receptor G2 n=1 Tax=Perca fluviatilis TaxID=8168 RepID=A0A6A5DVR3_PERFL|nr:hypothetical protein PFLUV_G00258280 [Perca fluviatilis]